jgi:hypothetical protein
MQPFGTENCRDWGSFYQELKIFHRETFGVFAQGYFANAADFVGGDRDAHDGLHLCGYLIDGDKAVMISIKEREGCGRGEGCAVFDYSCKPSARSISASYCRSHRLCMVLRNSSTVMKPLPSASNSWDS